MKIGDFVRNEHHGLQRYGKVIKKFQKKDGWTYFDIEWVDDEKYQSAVKNIEQRSNRQYEPKHYRSDQIHPLNLNKTIQTLLKLKNNAE